MNIYKFSTLTNFIEPSNIDDQSLFSFFKKVLPYLKWNSGGNNKFFRDNKGTFTTYRWGSINLQNIGTLPVEYYIRIFIGDTDAKSSYEITLLNNKTKKTIAAWKSEEIDENEDPVYSGKFQDILSGIKINNIVLPRSIAKPKDLSEAILNGKKVYNYIRLTKAHNIYGEAQSIEVWINPVQPVETSNCENQITEDSQFDVLFRNKGLETNLELKTMKINKDRLSMGEAIKTKNDFVKRAEANGYVHENSYAYIPETANDTNWDFALNIPKRKDKNSDDLSHDFVKKYIPTDEQEMIPESKRNVHMKKTSQDNYDFGGYYSGNIPDPTGYVGSSSVEASQIKSAFGGADKAISLVNEFNSDLLKNIAFIFNFSKAGAYGVYLSELDRAIKTEVLRKRLSNKGYKIIDQNGVLTAYPEKGEIDSDKINHDIENLYKELNSGGGTAIGINMSNVLSAATSDLQNIPSTERDFLFELLAVLHLGETIVHEAIHAKGHHDEGPSEQGESAFASWVLPKINTEYLNYLKSRGKESEFNEIIIGTSKRMASTTNWYKIAQFNLFSPNGSDLSGRMGGHSNQPGRQDWSMLFTQTDHASIEKRLGRQFMWPLAKDIDTDKDSIEEQLRKTVTSVRDSSMTTEELLQKDRVSQEEQYKSLEEKLKDTRPSALLQLLKKDASINKQATVFGWYNNLEISDGSTIPGLGDRVMPWDDRDEDFAWSDSEIRQQPRYNPEYDVKGFYYRWIEPRFAPQLFDDMTRDIVNTHPAKRFAEKEENKELSEIEKIVSMAIDRIKNKKIKACRFIVSEDLTPYILKLADGLNTCHFEIKNDGEPITALWICLNEVRPQEIEEAERYFSGEDSLKEKVENFLGKYNPNSTLDFIMSNLKEIKNETLGDIYLVGEAARQQICKEEITVNTFRFCCKDDNDSIVYGQELAEKIGTDFSYSKCGELYTFVNDIKIVFECTNNEKVFNQLITMGANEKDLDNDVKKELANKDFTINMMALNVIKNTVYDPFGCKNDLQNKVLKTKYDPKLIIEKNPIIILKAIALMKDGYEAEEALESIISNNINLLRDLKGEQMELARIFFAKNGMI